METCAGGAVALAEEGDFLGVAAEEGDVRFYPLQCESLIEDAGVEGFLGAEGEGVGEAEYCFLSV